MYDFANSGYTTVVLTAVFNAYFVSVVAGAASWATLAWTGALALSSLLVIVLAPVLGAWADRQRGRKRLLAASTIACVGVTAMLAMTGPGTMALAIVLIVLSNLFYSIGESVIASFLPDLAEPEAMGKLSGWGWGLGYFGGMLTLGLALFWVLGAEQRGSSAVEAVPQTMLLTAVVFLVAALPSFFWLRDRTSDQVGDGARAEPERLVTAWRSLLRSWRDAQRYVDLRRLLVCTACYQAGIAVVISLAAVYAEQAMGFAQTDTMLLVFVVNIAAAVGAFGFGVAQDRFGHKRCLAVTLLGWLAMTLIAGLGQSLFSFWFAGLLAGLCMGASQSGARAMVGLLAPSNRLGEFFGLWTLAVRVAAIVGPLTYGLVTWLSGGQHRLAMLLTGAFFLAGLVLLRGIDLQRGRMRALGHPGAADQD